MRRPCSGARLSALGAQPQGFVLGSRVKAPCVPQKGVRPLIGYIISLALIGLIVGALARLALPGRDPMSIFQTMLVSIAGSLAAGLVYAALFHRNGGGFIASVLF